MKLIVLSDLHFKEANDWIYIKKITCEMIKRIKNISKDNERFLFVILGDIIDGSNNNSDSIETRYNKAGKFIDYIKSQYSNSDFLFVPGNHDIYNNNLDHFNAFVQKYSYKQEFIFTKDKSIYSFIDSNVNLILVDSNLKRDYKANGFIDGPLLKKEIVANCKNLIFMHHPPCSQEMNDGSPDKALSNSNDLIDTHCNFVFYGHQHGGHKILNFFQQDTDIHGLSTFLVEESGVGNDFIMLHIEDGTFKIACRYNYTGAAFVKSRLFPQKTELKSHIINLDEPVENKSLEKPITRYYINNTSNKKQDIKSLLKYENKIMISGIAGIGKSYELRNIYWQFKNDEEYFPIWLNLKNAGYELAERYINYVRDNTVDNKEILLIIDGLSEVSGETAQKIICTISSVARGEHYAKIIISKRDNFNIHLDEFNTYYLQPFDEKDIISYAKQNGIVDTASFVECLSKTEYKEAAKTAFYLIEIVELYKQNKVLPVFQDLMNHVIRKRLIDSDKKINREYNKKLMANEYDLRYSFQELGFAMQATNKPSFNNLNYTQIFEPSIREWQKDTGFLRIDEETRYCEFDHDIFREYFVACYLYSLPFTELEQIISYGSTEKKPRPSWYNVIDNIVQMREDKDLLNWILEHDRDYFYQFESLRISTEKKDEMAIAILNDFFRKNLLIYNVYNDVEKFTRYFESEVMLEFIINTLKDTPNMYTILSIVYILRYITLFNDKKDDIYILLIEILKAEYPEYVYNFTMEALANMMSKDNDNIDTLIKNLIPIMQDKNRLKAVEAFFEIVSKSQNVDAYLDFVIGKYETVDRSTISVDFDEAFYTIMYNLKETESILKCIEYMCDESVHFLRAYHSDDYFEVIVNKLIGIFEDKDQVIFDKMLKIFCCISGIGEIKKIKAIKNFFKKTNTLELAIEKIISLDKPESPDIRHGLNELMDSSLTENLAQHYKNGKVDKYLYIWYAKRQPITSEEWKTLNDAYEEKEGCFIERKPPIDWQKDEHDGEQKYFNSLFNKNDFVNLVKQIIDILGEDIIVSTYYDKHFSKIPHDRQDLRLAATTISNFNNTDITLSEFLERIDWKVFQLVKIFEFIESTNNIKITDEQRNFIKIYFDNTISNNDFSKIDNNDKEKMWHARNIIMLVKKCGFICPDETLLQTLMLPWYVFTSFRSTGKSEALTFISEKISEQQLLRERIIYNINNVELSTLATQTHILYCLDNDISEAVDISIKLFYSTYDDAKIRKNTAVDYLIKNKGEKFVDNLIDDSTDILLLEYLAYKLKSKNQNLISALLKANDKSDNKMLFVSNLIKFNNSDGLQIYLDFVKNNNAIPEFKEGQDDYTSTYVTMSIREINNISLLDQVKQLILIAYGKDFKDIETWGLKGSLNDATSNLYHSHKTSVSKMLESLIDENPDNDHLLFYCNYHLNNIEKLSDITEKAWKFNQAFNYIKKRRILK